MWVYEYFLVSKEAGRHITSQHWHTSAWKTWVYGVHSAVWPNSIVRWKRRSSQSVRRISLWWAHFSWNLFAEHLRSFVPRSTWTQYSILRWAQFSEPFEQHLHKVQQSWSSVQGRARQCNKRRIIRVHIWPQQSAGKVLPKKFCLHWTRSFIVFLRRLKNISPKKVCSRWTASV